ncbi:hypothetical protein BD414DRAFT_463805 [Trametes punicea]|nr:hypothetical protein BD414DRAFT_463805 [Trametes punicea]
MADDPLLPLTVNNDHPLALELASLRSAVSRYQHEAHATSLKLQRHSLEAFQAVEHARALERENARLKEEVAVLRANPDATPAQSTGQVSELTLALRRLSEKLTAVEDTLLMRAKQLADTRSELANAQHEIEAARALAADARAREEEGLARERELACKLKAAEEERRMADLAVQEYADLVRKLEGRARAPSGSSTSSIDFQRPSNEISATLADCLAEGKSGLRRLLKEFNSQNEHLESEIAKLHGDNGLLYKELEVARLRAEHDRSELAKAVHELDIYRADDATAAKMVSRYMKFSQSSTDKLQEAIDALKARHAATLASLNVEIAHLQHALEQERTETERLRSALDELTEDIAREAYGRRREVSLRLAFLGREENLAESLRRWIRRARESLERTSGDSGDGELNAIILREAFARSVLEADDLLETLNSQPSMQDDERFGGSIARLILAQDAISSLTQQLQEETVRRLKTERKLARLDTSESSHPQQTVHAVVQPVPHRASVGQSERPLLLGQSLPASGTVSVTEPRVASAALDAPSVDIHIDEIVIVPSLDPVPQLVAAERPQVAATIPVVEETASHSPPIVTPQNPPEPPPTTDTGPSPNQADSGILLPDDKPELGATSSSPEIPVPDSTHKDDTLPVPNTISSQVSNTGEDPPLASALRAPQGYSASPSRDKPDIPSTPPSGSSRPSDAIVPPPLQLDATNGSTLFPLTAEPSCQAQESQEALLLAKLRKVKHRYDDVQRGFRDCHLALRELRNSLAELSSPATETSSEMLSLLRKAVDRLSDFNEDARVELEIRIADEERVASGYEALLSIPGAMSHSDNSEAVDKPDVLNEIRAFVDGTDRAVAKGTQSFAHKLDDLQHDIASIKRTLHELALPSPEDRLSAPGPSRRTSTSPSWSSWTPSFLSPPRSTSPAPTFGSVMTSPRLRHSPSFSHPRESSAESPTDPLASLGLRIAVPSPVRSPTYGGLNAGPAESQRAGPRQRTTSGMFMLGLGMRSTSFGSGLGVHASASASRSSLASAGVSTSPSASRLATVSPRKENSGEGEEDVDSDIE